MIPQDVGLALGHQAEAARIRDVVTQGGFNRFTKVAETPFTQVLEIRPWPRPLADLKGEDRPG